MWCDSCLSRISLSLSLSLSCDVDCSLRKPYFWVRWGLIIFLTILLRSLLGSSKLSWTVLSFAELYQALLDRPELFRTIKGVEGACTLFAAKVVGGGGGGFGEPQQRSPELVLEDVRQGKISAERAEAIYGVVITDQLTVDEDATNHRRQSEQ